MRVYYITKCINQIYKEPKVPECIRAYMNVLEHIHIGRENEIVSSLKERDRAANHVPMASQSNSWVKIRFNGSSLPLIITAISSTCVKAYLT